jgi:hypothetical protein
MSSIEKIRKAMEDFLRESDLNKVESLGLSRIYDSPLIGVSDAADPLFIKLKDPAVIWSRSFIALRMAAGGPICD